MKWSTFTLMKVLGIGLIVMGFLTLVPIVTFAWMHNVLALLALATGVLLLKG